MCDGKLTKAAVIVSAKDATILRCVADLLEIIGFSGPDVAISRCAARLLGVAVGLDEILSADERTTLDDWLEGSGWDYTALDEIQYKILEFAKSGEPREG